MWCDTSNSGHAKVSSCMKIMWRRTCQSNHPGFNVQRQTIPYPFLISSRPWTLHTTQRTYHELSLICRLGSEVYLLLHSAQEERRISVQITGIQETTNTPTQAGNCEICFLIDVPCRMLAAICFTPLSCFQAVVFSLEALGVSCRSPLWLRCFIRQNAMMLWMFGLRQLRRWWAWVRVGCQWWGWML